MTSLFRTFSRAVTCAGLAALGWSVVAQAQGPTVFNACVTPLTGLLYQPKEAGKCFLPSHQPIKWTDALGAILSGSVANGDLDGTYPNPKVDGLRGRPVAEVAPTTNQILAWNGAAWAPKDPTGGGAIGAAGGALTGTYPNPALAEGAVTTASLANGSVTEPKLAFNPATQEELEAAIATAAAATATLQTNINAVNEAITAYKALLSNSGGTANAAGNPLSWTQLKDVPTGVISGGAASGIAGGDLSGNYPNPAVAKLQGTAVSSTAPTNGQVLAFNGTSWTPVESPAGGSGTTGQNSVTLFGTPLFFQTGDVSTHPIPGLTTTINVPANSVTIISTDGGVVSTGGPITIVLITLTIDGATVGRRMVAAPGPSIYPYYWSMQRSVELPPGSHSIQVTAYNLGGSAAQVSVDAERQRTLTVTTLKL